MRDAVAQPLLTQVVRGLGVETERDRPKVGGAKGFRVLEGLQSRVVNAGNQNEGVIAGWFMGLIDRGIDVVAEQRDIQNLHARFPKQKGLQAVRPRMPQDLVEVIGFEDL